MRRKPDPCRRAPSSPTRPLPPTSCLEPDLVRPGFETSDEYSDRLATIREEQKSLIKLGQATHCEKKWTVDGDAKAGQKMIDEQAKLMLRAFNGECDAAIAKVKFDNVVTLELRITKSCEDLNKLGRSKHVSITSAYRHLRLAELRLVHEHREKLQAEKEEQRRIKEQMRDEQKAQQEIERAQAEAEKEEAQNQRALEKARAELAAAAAKEQEKLAELERQLRDAGALEKAPAELAASANTEQERLAGLVDRLETELSAAIDRKAKAIARAQLTRSGHVYVLSNIGSFGDGIYKIGLTRRLDPFERVEELGDASVPFAFDVHAIIYAVDAPALEFALHREFANRRVNMVNNRKEYFRVSLDEIRTAVEKHHGLVTFVLSAEAQEYRKTCALAAEAMSSEPALPT